MFSSLREICFSCAAFSFAHNPDSLPVLLFIHTVMFSNAWYFPILRMVCVLVNSFHHPRILHRASVFEMCCIQSPIHCSFDSVEQWSCNGQKLWMTLALPTAMAIDAPSFAWSANERLYCCEWGKPYSRVFSCSFRWRFLEFGDRRLCFSIDTAALWPRFAWDKTMYGEPSLSGWPCHVSRVYPYPGTNLDSTWSRVLAHKLGL